MVCPKREYFFCANVSIYVYMFCIATFANAGINIIYLVSNIFGWYMWSRSGSDDERLKITRNTKKQNIISWFSFVVIYVLHSSFLDG